MEIEPNQAQKEGEMMEITTVKQLDEYAKEQKWVSRRGSAFETRGVGLTRYGALKRLYGEQEAKRMRELLPLTSSSLMPESTLDGKYIVIDRHGIDERGGLLIVDKRAARESGE